MKAPNVLLICCDQLSAQALRPWGNRDANTPNLDRLAAKSLKFRQAYSNCPLCLPSRASFWSGQYPHQTGILANGGFFPVPALDASAATLGSVFQEAGYRCVHYGKTHDGGALKGFDVTPPQQADPASLALNPHYCHNYDSLQDADTVEHMLDFLQTHPEGEPFLAVADLNNPHNICQWIGENRNELPLTARFEDVPDLPDNLYIDQEEMKRRPLPIQYLPYAHRRQAQMAGWDEDKIHHYLNAYHYYLSLADAQIGQMLQTLADRKDGKDTLVVFFADHGDSMCGRWMGTKHTSFYEETVHVPLMFSGAGVASGDGWAEGLCSLIDLVPTLCEFAGVEQADSFSGTSLCPQLEGGRSNTEREAVYAQWHTEFGYTIEPGRMVRTANFKYTQYREEDGEELYDLARDPGETKNLTLESDYAETLESHRRLLAEYCETHKDPFFNLDYLVDSRYREGPPDYRAFSGMTSADVNGR